MLVLGLIDVPVWLMLLIAIVSLYFIGTRNHDYFKKRGVPGPKPLPFIGNVHTLIMDVYNFHSKWKKEYEKVCGMFMGSQPNYIIFDEEMISQICVKQFKYFGDKATQKTGEFFDHTLITLKGDHWKYVRSQMSPAFTTGKLRLMGLEINRGGKAFVKNILSKSGLFEARAVARAFAMDVIASTAFGLRLESQENEDNIFMKMGKAVTKISIRSGFILLLVCPKLIPYLNKIGFTIIDKAATNFFISVFNQTFDGRVDAEDQSRADFIQLMVQARQGHDITDKEDHDKKKPQDETNTEETKFKGLSKDEILSNALLFIFGGYDTTSAGLSFLMYDLACNPECQDKLIREIASVVGNGEEISYDAAMKLQYLDQCIQESLRLQPPVIILDRVAKCDTVVCGVPIGKGAVVVIPVRAIHHDPKIWPDPLKFDPERFSPENKANISPCHWIPFGYGPRNCIGMRLALFEIKIAIATLLKSHKLMSCEKTEIPLKLSKTSIMKPENGIFLTVEKR